MECRINLWPKPWNEPTDRSFPHKSSHKPRNHRAIPNRKWQYWTKDAKGLVQQRLNPFQLLQCIQNHWQHLRLCHANVLVPCCSAWQLSSTRVSFLRGSIYLALPLALSDCQDVDWDSCTEDYQSNSKYGLHSVVQWEIQENPAKLVNCSYPLRTRDTSAAGLIILCGVAILILANKVTPAWPSLRSQQNLHFSPGSSNCGLKSVLFWTSSASTAAGSLQ